MNYSRKDYLLLSMFDENRPNGYIPYKLGWLELLGVELDKKINQFLLDGVIEYKGLQEKITHKYLVINLKELLRDRNLKVSGKKEVLIARLIQEDMEYLEKQVADVVLLGCTSQGLSLVKQFKAFCKQEYHETEKLVIDAILERKFTTAVDYVYDYVNKQITLSGYAPYISVSFHYTQTEDFVQKLSNLHSITPAIYKNLNENEKNILRLTASLLVLGIKPPKWIFTQDFFPDILIKDNIWASRALIYSLNYQKRLEDIKTKRNNYLNEWNNCKDDPELLEIMREMNTYEYIKILTSNDNYVCSECKEMSKRKYKIDDVPELPYSKCTSEIGCRCSIHPYSES